ncbi:MAG TPA: OmpA family protein [Alphaproteobacteria bacterium]|nr:OmpA family protein [Alphaproteobacteria bacterium]
MRFVWVLALGLLAAACGSTDDMAGGASAAATAGTGAGAATGDGVTAPPGTQEHLEQVTSTDRVFFEFDKHSLTPEARAQVEDWAGWLLANRNVRILIEGHADERGTTEYNFALGARRSHAVKSALESLGISGDRIETTTFGELRPAVDASNEAAWAQNRRAVVVVQAGAVS